MTVRRSLYIAGLKDGKCVYTVVFCTKYGRRLFDTPDMRSGVDSILRATLDPSWCTVVDLTVNSNHVIAVLEVKPAKGIYRAVRRMKRLSYPALCEAYPELCTRVPTVWTRRELILSMSSGIPLSAVCDFIDIQTRSEV